MEGRRVEMIDDIQQGNSYAVVYEILLQSILNTSASKSVCNISLKCSATKAFEIQNDLIITSFKYFLHIQ